MIYGLSTAIVVIIALIIKIVLMYRKLKGVKSQLKELIKENDSQQEILKKKNEEIAFKTDKELIITSATEALTQELGFKAEDLIGKSIFGTLLEDNDAMRSYVKSYTSKIIKQADIVNNKLIILNNETQKQPMSCHQRPILNEILECTGISFTCKNIAEAYELKTKLEKIRDKDVLTNTLNQEAFIKHLERNFQRAKRYNQDFALLVVDLRDLCEFINNGISFETGDKLLKTVTDLCSNKLKNSNYIGRFEKTKLGLILNGYTREKAATLAQELFVQIKPAVRKLGVDDYNAQMVIISYTERKGFNDTYDNMLERTKRHLKNARRRHEYGVTTSDNEQKKVLAQTKFEA